MCVSLHAWQSDGQGAVCHREHTSVPTRCHTRTPSAPCVSASSTMVGLPDVYSYSLADVMYVCQPAWLGGDSQSVGALRSTSMCPHVSAGGAASLPVGLPVGNSYSLASLECV